MTLADTIARLKTAAPEAAVAVEDVSRWSVGMHVHHCALATIGVCEELRKPPPEGERERWSLVKNLVLLTGWIPRGFGQSPEVVLPEPNVDAEQLAGLLDRADALAREAEQAGPEAAFRHPIFGLLRKDRALRFTAIHNHHHLKIVQAILERRGA